MNSLAILALIAICCQFGCSAGVVLQETVSGNVLSMNANGQVILVVNFDGNSLVSSQITIFFKKETGYEKVEVKDLSIYVGTYRNYNRPRLSDDGLYMYFIHGDTGLVAKGSLMNTSPAQPYVQVMSINNWACQGLRFQCRFALSGDYLAFYSHSSKVLSVANRDSVLLFNNSIECTRYPHYPEFEQFYECTQYRQSTRPQYNPYNCPSINQNFGLSQNSSSTQSQIISCNNSFCFTAGNCDYVYQQNSYQYLLTAPEITSIHLSLDGKAVTLRTQYTEYKYYYRLNFTANNFDFSTIRRDLQPEIFPNPTNSFSFWARQSGTQNELQLKSGLGNIKMRRQFDTMFYLETSKDQRTTQGYSYSSGSSYFIELVQAATVTENQDPDLRVTQSKPIGMFDLSADGSKIAYLCDGNIVLVEHKLGTFEAASSYSIVEKHIQKLSQSRQIFVEVSIITASIFSIMLVVIALIYHHRQPKQESKQKDHLNEQIPEPSTNFGVNSQQLQSQPIQISQQSSHKVQKK